MWWRLLIVEQVVLPQNRLSTSPINCFRQIQATNAMMLKMNINLENTVRCSRGHVQCYQCSSGHFAKFLMFKWIRARFPMPQRRRARFPVPSRTWTTVPVPSQTCTRELNFAKSDVHKLPSNQRIVLLTSVNVSKRMEREEREIRGSHGHIESIQHIY